MSDKKPKTSRDHRRTPASHKWLRILKNCPGPGGRALVPGDKVMLQRVAAKAYIKRKVAVEIDSPLPAIEEAKAIGKPGQNRVIYTGNRKPTAKTGGVAREKLSGRSVARARADALKKLRKAAEEARPAKSTEKKEGSDGASDGAGAGSSDSLTFDQWQELGWKAAKARFKELTGNNPKGWDEVEEYVKSQETA